MNRISAIVLLILSLVASLASVHAAVETREGLLTNSFGQSLYVFDPDQGAAVPACNETCAEKWPPALLSAAEAASLKAPLAAVPRGNGLLQLTVNGRPVYAFFLDRVPGDTLGDGLGGVWHVVPAPMR